MVILNLIKYSFWRVLEKICPKFNIYLFIKTHTGIKSVNIDRLYGDNTLVYNHEDIIAVEPSNLFLSIDYLSDKYTLLDICVLDSPHYSLIEAVNSGKDLRKTDYYKRFVTGKLDGRHCLRERGASYFYEKNENAKRSIEQGDYEPVVVYLLNGRYYICDGKHRAALCAYMKKDVRCVVVPSITGFKHRAINKEIYRIMAGDKNYSKHINYLNNGEK